MVLPRFEAVSEPAASSASAAPQQAAPTARPESIIEPPAAPPTSSHDIRVQVPDNKGGSTQVRFVESGGEVRVSVRTADEGLAQNLRTHLNDLTQRLSDGGTPAEIWKPASSAASSQNDSAAASQPRRSRFGRTGVRRPRRTTGSPAETACLARGNGSFAARRTKLGNHIRNNGGTFMTIQGQNPVTDPTSNDEPGGGQHADDYRPHAALPLRPPRASTAWPTKIRSCNCWWPRSRIRIRPTPPIPFSSSPNWRNSASWSN